MSTTVQRRRISLTLSVLSSLEVILLLANRASPIFMFVGLITVSIVPGWLMVGSLTRMSASLRIALTVTLSWAVMLLAAQICITVHLWYPRFVLVAIMSFCTLLLVRRRRSRYSDKYA